MCKKGNKSEENYHSWNIKVFSGIDCSLVFSGSGTVTIHTPSRFERNSQQNSTILTFENINCTLYELINPLINKNEGQ